MYRCHDNYTHHPFLDSLLQLSLGRTGVQQLFKRFEDLGVYVKGLDGYK